MAAAERVKVLFLCTGNSCRSQMAEGWAKALKGAEVDAYSAGTSPHGMNARAVAAMREAGVDLSEHASKDVGALAGVRFDVVVTVCDSAHEACPVVPGARVVHVGFEDPPRLARDAGTEEEAMGHYRRVRDEIRRFVETLPGSILNDTAPRTVGARGKELAMKTKDQKSCCGPSCCGGAGASEPAAETVREQVRAGYAAIAKAGSCSVGPAGGGGCCGPTTFTPDDLARAIGYSGGELAGLPEGANLGLSCGNPTAIASLKAGERVLDLGSGGGFDCFVAGAKVGATGVVIGVDMTPEMVSRARKNTAGYRERTGLDNVQFRLGEIENMPVTDASVDVVISNCVLNLSPDKGRVWKEIARVLRPGGRVAVSDLALLKPLPAAVRGDLEALIGCIAGAALVEEFRAAMEAAGLTEIVLTPKPGYVEALTNSADPLYAKVTAGLPAGSRPGDYVTSLDISARKPS